MEKAEKILIKGVHLINEGNMNEGLEVLSQLDQLFVDNNYLLDIYIKKADTLFEAELVSSEEKIEKYKEAKKIYEQIIKKFPTSERALPLYFKAADCSKRLGLLDRAFDFYEGDKH